MKVKKIVLGIFLFVIGSSFAQNSVTEINTKNGITYLTTDINYSVTGVYQYKGKEPIVELNVDGSGFYQTEGEQKKAINWGFECSKDGVPKFVKGFDSIEYVFYYKYIYSDENDSEWKKVEFSIHLNSMKMFINGERVKIFTPKEKQKKLP
ncbi:hypothetical protein [Flavobacterium sp.]|uniref:hypothetical protein n=1 Tax=Flavobacterium sp. TaxID=239 RepID=UPI0037C05785